MSRVDEQDPEPHDSFDNPPAWTSNLAWLAEADREQAEERLDRLAGDRDLEATLRRAGFAGPDYVVFANEIARYGLAVIRGWIYRGQILSEVAKKSFGALPPEPYEGAMVDDADGLADETIVKALEAFRTKVLLAGRWDPTKGASLRTFFVGQCLLQFSNVYRVWHNAARRNRATPWEPPEGNDWDDFDGRVLLPHPAAADATIGIHDELRRAFGHITDQRARTAFYLQAMHGCTHEQIGEKLGMSAKAVESAMARARAQVAEGRRTA